MSSDAPHRIPPSMALHLAEIRKALGVMPFIDPK